MEANQGLFYKYNIEKADGSEINPAAEYFVLRYDDQQHDKIHMHACQKALLRYAAEIEDHLPQLSKDLKKKLAKYSTYGHF